MNSKKFLIMAVASLFMTGLALAVPAFAFNITYDPNGGNVAPEGANVKTLPDEGDSYTLITDLTELGITAPEGKVFNLWCSWGNGSNPIEEIDLPVDSDKTVYAIWIDDPAASEPTTYNVTYDRGVVDGDSPYEAGVTVTVMPKPVDEIPGKEFVTWTTNDLKVNPEDPKVEKQPGSTFTMPNKDVSFEALYRDLVIGSYVEIIFDPKVPANEYSTYGREIVYQNFPGKNPVTAYYFEFPDGNDNDLHWLHPDPDANDIGRWGLDAEYAQSLYYSLGNKTPADPVRPGYRFHGWYLINNSTNTTDPITGDSPYDFKNRPVNDHTYLSALWWKGIYSITYLDNGVDVGDDYPTNPKSYSYNSPTVTLERPHAKPGFGSENGCPCDENGSDTLGGRRWLLQGTNTEITTVPDQLKALGLGDVVLVASYKPCEYELHYWYFDPEEDDWVEFEDLKPDTFNATSPKRLPGATNDAIIQVLGEDYDFGGWYLDRNLTQGPYQMTPAITEDNEYECEFDFFLKVVPKEYTITYHLEADDATNDPSNPNSYNATTFNVPIKPATRPGYFFGGWLLDNIDGQYINNVREDLDPFLDVNGTVKYRDIDLYAVWTDKMFRIIYMDIDIRNSLSLHDTGGILKGPFVERTDLSPKTYDVSKNDTKLPVPAAPIGQPADVGGFDFLGWYLNDEWTNEITNKNESGQYVATNGILGDITVYAKWEFAGDGWGIITYIPKNGENACEPGDPIWQEVVRDGTYAKNYGNYHNPIKQPGNATMTRVTEDGRVFEFVGWNLAEPYERDGYCARVSQTIGCGADCAYNFNKSVVNENITLGGSWKLVSIPTPPQPTDPCNPCDPTPPPQGIVFVDIDGNVIFTGQLDENGQLPEVDGPSVRGKVFVRWQVKGMEDSPAGTPIPANAYVYPIYVDIPSLTGGEQADIGDVLVLLQYVSGTGILVESGKTDADLIAMGADLNQDGVITIADVLIMLKNV